MNDSSLDEHNSLVLLAPWKHPQYCLVAVPASTSSIIASCTARASTPLATTRARGEEDISISDGRSRRGYSWGSGPVVLMPITSSDYSIVVLSVPFIVLGRVQRGTRMSYSRSKLTLLNLILLWYGCLDILCASECSGLCNPSYVLAAYVIGQLHQYFPNLRHKLSLNML